jgi:hypothetical protein
MGAKISFFENIIYWIWFYSLKFKAMYPWRFAHTVTSLLKCSNVAFIAFIIYKIINIESSEDVIGFVTYTLCVIIIIADSIIYDSNKYCVLKTKYYVALNEQKFCILKERYDSLSRNAMKRHKKRFYMYLIITAVTDTVFLIILLS